MATILIADDKVRNRRFLATLFGVVGHKVLEAVDGAEALALASSHLIDLLFSDVLMPVMDGLELVRNIRSDPKLAKIPIIFYTPTYHGEGFKKLAEELRIAVVIAKPSEPQAILNAISGVLGNAPRLLSSDPQARFEAAPQNRMTEEFFGSVEDLGATVLRLTATIELGIDLTREREPARLVETFCRGAQGIIGAKYAACGMIGHSGNEIAYLHTCGMPPETADLLRAAARQGTLFRWMLANRSADRRRSIAGDLWRAGLPEEHPWIDSFLGVPIHGSNGDTGWLYLAEKFGGGQFTDEDEQLASTLAWQASAGYENAHLHHVNTRCRIEIERQAALLAVQIVEQEQVERKRLGLEHQLLQTQKIEALGTLAGGMAHDINNCLVPILSLTALALETLPARSQERPSIELIKEAGERIRDLVGRILIFSRREEIGTASIDLAAILRESVSLLRAMLPTSIALRSRIEPNAAFVQGDAGQIRQILMNLCVNAGDAIGNRTNGTIEVYLDPVDLQGPLQSVEGSIEPGRYYRLRIIDNGEGMDEATLGRIFEPFYTTKEPGKGTGLGLAMVHTIVHSHSGHLRVTSRPGAGTAFEVYLPENDAVALSAARSPAC